MLTSLVCLLALSASNNANFYPLAAALVLDGKLAIADVPTRQLTYVPLVGLSPEQADLSLDRKHIVISATESGSAGMHLYLVDPETGKFQKLAAGEDTSQSYPRFADDGAEIVFTASSTSGPDRVRRLRIADGSVEDIPGQPKQSNRIPVSWDKSRVAYVTSDSNAKHDLRVETTTTQKQRIVAHLAGETPELTTSPDQKKLVYTNRENGNLKFYLAQGNAAPRALAAFSTTEETVQPRFVCPRDVLFVSKKKVWVLNSDTGLVTELEGFNEATGAPIDTNTVTADNAK